MAKFWFRKCTVTSLKEIVHQLVKKLATWYEKLHIFDDKILVVLHLWYFEFVHWIENGYSKQIKKKNKFWKKPEIWGKGQIHIVPEKFIGVSSVFHWLTHTWKYWRTIFIFGKLRHKFLTSTLVKFMLYLNKFFTKLYLNQKLLFRPFYLKNEWIYWLEIHVTVIEGFHF